MPFWIMKAHECRKYERPDDRKEYSSDHYSRNFQARAGEVKLMMPERKGVPFKAPLLNGIAAEDAL